MNTTTTTTTTSTEQEATMNTTTKTQHEIRSESLPGKTILVHRREELAEPFLAVVLGVYPAGVTYDAKIPTFGDDNFAGWNEFFVWSDERDSDFAKVAQHVFQMKIELEQTSRKPNSLEDRCVYCGQQLDPHNDTDSETGGFWSGHFACGRNSSGIWIVRHPNGHEDRFGSKLAALGHALHLQDANCFHGRTPIFTVEEAK